MSAQKYSFQNYNPDRMARVLGVSLSVSTKQCIEICNHLRGRPVAKAKKILQDAIDLKKAIPFKRFTDGVGHRKGKDINAGRYVCKAASEVLKLLESCEKNAQYKGLSSDDLIIIHINSHRGSQQWHYGRQRRRKMKRTHIEIIVEEKASSKGAKATKKKAQEDKPVEKQGQAQKIKPAEAEKSTASSTEDIVKEAQPSKEKPAAKKAETSQKEPEKKAEASGQQKVKTGETSKADNDGDTKKEDDKGALKKEAKSKVETSEGQK